ncbi:hypothetical protein NDU88_005688 [Pleurodeles waltl]|uniref:Uncharacterized protein n=1 Tax=Pleurodeles waltl TaxID=8319 RepID=A0AAV7VMI5_PLEWA|nr:hypothetical protein NDU88_005688 [Pleurodeles waltl]
MKDGILKSYMERSCGEAKTAWVSSRLQVTRIDGSVLQPHGPGLKTGLRGAGHAVEGADRFGWSRVPESGSPGSQLLISWCDLLGAAPPLPTIKQRGVTTSCRGPEPKLAASPGDACGPPLLAGSRRGLRDPARGAGVGWLGRVKCSNHRGRGHAIERRRPVPLPFPAGDRAIEARMDPLPGGRVARQTRGPPGNCAETRGEPRCGAGTLGRAGKTWNTSSPATG